MAADLPQWCINCGLPLHGNRFCTNCGHEAHPAPASPDTVVGPAGPVSLHKPAPEESASAVTVNRADLQQHLPPGPPPVPPPPPYLPSASPHPDSPRPRRRSPVVVVAAVVAVVLLLAGVGTAAYLLGKEDRDDATATRGNAEDVAQDASAVASDRDDGDATDDGDAATAAPDDASEAVGDDSPSADSVPLDPVVLRDAQADTRHRNNGPNAAGAGDIVRVTVQPQRDDRPGWVSVDFAGGDPGGSGVLVRFDVDGDELPDFVTWRDTATGATGSSTSRVWLPGRDLLMGPQDDDRHFTGSVTGGTGVVFPVAFDADELDDGRLRVNVQVITQERYYDYAPARHRWTTSVQFRTAD